MDGEGATEASAGVKEGKWAVIVSRCGGFVEELKRVSYIAAPMVVVSMLQYLIQVVALIMAGHLDELSLSGVSIASSFANVTGFSVMFGLAEGLETLCGQAYGAEQYEKFGTFTYSAMISLIPICIPISILWIFMGKLLIAIGLDSEIAETACRYTTWLIPALFGYAFLQALLRYYQSQSLIFPLLVSYCLTLGLHIPMCWILVYKCGLGDKGAALSVGVAYWFNVIFLAGYMRLSTSCKKTRALYKKDVLVSIKKFLRFAVPASLMVCLEWWTFELIVLLAGLLPNSKLEIAVLAICLLTSSWHYFLQCGIGSAASTRISNELGAGNAEEAQAVVRVVVVMSLTIGTIASATLFFCRRMYGYTFSNDKNVAHHFAEIAPLLCLSLVVDSSLAVIAGIARGCGWQHIGAFINLGAYYLFGIPLSVVLCFVLRLRGKGLWIGILAGSTLQATLLALITAFTDWKSQAIKARKRVFDGTSPGHNNVLPVTSEVELHR